MSKRKTITTKDFDEKFEKGEDLSESVDLDNMLKRVAIDLPVWAMRVIDREADRRGMARQSLLKNWIIDTVDSLQDERK